MAEYPIHIASLRLDRGDHRVLDGLDLGVDAGEIHALLGGNGAGKSSTLAAILGLLPIQAGRIRVAGFCPFEEPGEARRRVALLPESVALYEHLSARENLDYFLHLAGESRTRTEVSQALESVQLDERAWDLRAKGFSKGMRQKTAIALALLRRTPILMLDEPTSGLDPSATVELHRLIASLRNAGIAVLMVTHDLLGAAEVADRISVLRGGRIAGEWRVGDGLQPSDLGAIHHALLGRSAG